LRKKTNQGKLPSHCQCPYGICETKITEFLVGDTPVELELKLDVSPTRGNVAIVEPSNQLKLEVVDVRFFAVRRSQQEGSFEAL
jgi:hypothetical protein